MAQRRVKRERVQMTAPGGTKVTVGPDSVERYTALGYEGAEAPKKAAPRKAEPKKSDTDSE